ncbi:MAG: TRAP transporter small permease [Bacteroidales bacterium]
MRKSIDKVLGMLLIVLMSVLIIDVMWQVISRYVLAHPSSFTDEIAGYLLVWVGLLGAAYVAGEKEHLAIDLLLQRSKGRTRMVIEMIIYTITGLFVLFVLVIGGTNLVYTRFLLHVTSASLELNLGYVYLVLPISGILTLYYTIDNARKTLNSDNK